MEPQWMEQGAKRLILLVGAEGFEPPASCSQRSFWLYTLSTVCLDLQPLTWIRGFCFRSFQKSFGANNLGFWNSFGTAGDGQPKDSRPVNSRMSVALHNPLNTRYFRRK